jgi:uncharacterized membrane protein (DUF485 family)
MDLYVGHLIIFSVILLLAVRAIVPNWLGTAAFGIVSGAVLVGVAAMVAG